MLTKLHFVFDIIVRKLITGHEGRWEDSNVPIIVMCIIYFNFGGVRIKSD